MAHIIDDFIPNDDTPEEKGPPFLERVKGFSAPGTNLPIYKLLDDDLDIRPAIIGICGGFGSCFPNEDPEVRVINGAPQMAHQKVLPVAIVLNPDNTEEGKAIVMPKYIFESGYYYELFQNDMAMIMGSVVHPHFICLATVSKDVEGKLIFRARQVSLARLGQVLAMDRVLEIF